MDKRDIYQFIYIYMENLKKMVYLNGVTVLS